jgi:hypothetical protein
MTSTKKKNDKQMTLLEDGASNETSLTGDADLESPPLSKAVGSRRGRKTIQDVLLREGLVAVRLAVGLASAEQLQEKLLQELSQNGAETRRRYAQSILLWFFGDGIDGLARQTWQAYEDEHLERDILRYLYLTAEQLVGKCVENCLFPLEEGMVIPAAYFERYLHNVLGDAPPPKTLERLKMNLAKLGFLDRSASQGDRLGRINVDKTAFLIVFHAIFSPSGPRTVELASVLSNPFWKHLGLKSEQAVRALLREADAGQLLGKYVVADQLEQVTTCFSLRDLLKQRARL